MVLGNNGIFESAQSAGDRMKMEAVKERIETIKVAWTTEKIAYNNVTVEDFWQDLEDANIIDDKETDINLGDNSTENGVKKEVYEVETTERYIVEIIVTEDENGKINITIGDIDLSTSQKPKVKITSLTSTDTSIAVEVSVSRMEEGTLTYSYKEQGTEEWTVFANKTTSLTATATGLTTGKTYEIKIKAENSYGYKEVSKYIIIGKLAEGTITPEITWNVGKATLKLSTTSGMNIQYHIGATLSDNWKTYQETGITNLSNNTTVTARLTDGINYGTEVTFLIIDDIKPSATINATTSYTITSGTTTSLSATVTQEDSESGVNLSNSRYVFTETATELGTDASSYTDGKFSRNEQTITKTGVSKGTYYLHVLTIDYAGNVKETISDAITVTQLVTGISLNQTTAEMGIGDTLTLTATVEPSTASNKSVKWSSSDTSVATVSSSGVITIVSSGTATITVTAADGSEVKATCEVTVSYETISTTKSYVGYYADVDGNGTVDGVIFADLMIGGRGTWNPNGDTDKAAKTGGAYSITKISSAKEYTISQSYSGKFGIKPVLKASGSGNDRFYVMALSDFTTSSYTTFYWYFYAQSNMSDYSSATSVSFGKGKTNTATMISKWNNSTYGSQYARDIFGLIQTEYSNGWFIPSANEWAAFGGVFNVTVHNSNSTYGLNNMYLTSSQYNEMAWYVTSYRSGCMINTNNGNEWFVRLCTTF